MKATNKNLTLLSQAEQSALYELPDFDEEQRQVYCTFTQTELDSIYSRPSMTAQIYCAIQVAYFKAKQLFFQFTWADVDCDDLTFIIRHYFDDLPLEKNNVNKHEFYKQCEMISDLFGYRRCSKEFVKLLHNYIVTIARRDVTISFIIIEALDFLQKNKIIRPGYTTLQTIISGALTVERKRLATLLIANLSEENKLSLRELLQKDDILSDLAALKQDAKNFKPHMVTSELTKFSTINSLYQLSKEILPKLLLSKQNINYYASLAHYYNV